MNNLNSFLEGGLTVVRYLRKTYIWHGNKRMYYYFTLLSEPPLTKSWICHWSLPKTGTYLFRFDILMCTVVNWTTLRLRAHNIFKIFWKSWLTNCLFLWAFNIHSSKTPLCISYNFPSESIFFRLWYNLLSFKNIVI